MKLELCTVEGFKSLLDKMDFFYVKQFGCSLEVTVTRYHFETRHDNHQGIYIIQDIEGKNHITVYYPPDLCFEDEFSVFRNFSTILINTMFNEDLVPPSYGLESYRFVIRSDCYKPLYITHIDSDLSRMRRLQWVKIKEAIEHYKGVGKL